jgi:hypothetical protein
MMGTYDTRGGGPLSPEIDDSGPSQLVEAILAVLEGAGVDAAINDKVAALIESAEVGALHCRARPISEYHSDMGDVLWWRFPISEPPYVGTPDDLGHTVRIEAHLKGRGQYEPPQMLISVGGWPGYHTHFTPIAAPEDGTA